MFSAIGVECGIPGTAAGRVVATALAGAGLDNLAELELVVAAELLAAAVLVGGVLLDAAGVGEETPVSEAVPPTVLHAANTTASAARPTPKT